MERMRRRWSAALVTMAGLMGGACSGPLALSDVNEVGFFTSRGAELHYVLDLPTGQGPFPAVVLGHGSGPKTIDDLRGFAERLLAGGYAVPRFDKQGTGRSGGTYRRIGRDPSAAELFPELAADLEEAVRVAARHPQVDAGRVGLMGESQAGWIVPLAASREPSVAFNVLLSGPAVDVGLNIAYERFTQESGLSLNEAYDRLASEGFQPDWSPDPYLGALTETPSLWILGELDALVPTRLSVEVLEGYRGEGYPFEVRVLDEHDHGLRPIGGTSGIEYWPILFTWLDGALEGTGAE